MATSMRDARDVVIGELTEALERFIALDPKDRPARREAMAHGSWLLAQLKNKGWR